MGLVRSGVSFDIHEVELKNKPEKMLQISPKGTVPVLQCLDGAVIDESLDIIAWALPEEWQGIDKQLIADNDGTFKKALDRYKYPTRYPDEDCSGARDCGAAFLQKLDSVVNTEDQNLTDICLFPFVRQFANVDKDWFDALPYTRLQQWLEFNLNSDLFQTIMDKNFKGKDS